MSLGGYYIKGGLYQLIEALVNIAKELNVRLNTEKRVESILHDNQRIKGVMIDGEKIDVDVILCNSDVVVSYNDLIEGFPRTKEKLNQLEPSLSGMIFFGGIRGHYS